MKLSCLQEHLKRGLAIVSHAVPGKSPLPVLSNILLTSDDGRLKLAATNLEIGITCWIDPSRQTGILLCRRFVECRVAVHGSGRRDGTWTVHY